MSNILQEICDKKLEHIKEQKQKTTIEALSKKIGSVTLPRGFAKALRVKQEKAQFGLIAEIKKASPSHGLIREDFNPIELAQSYKKGGATCLSILTDVPYFQGCDDYVTLVRSGCDLPILRKDFMLDPYQVFEARAIGADCILIIMAVLSDAQAQEIENVAFELGMDVLIEVHDEEELNRALKLKSNLVGVNNRNLKDLSIDLNTAIQLSSLLNEDYIIVSESGLKTHEDLILMQENGINCFLIGEGLMRQNDVTSATQRILGQK